jgi:hypothetical protein
MEVFAVSSETEAWQANSLEEVEFGIFKNFLYKNSGGEVGNVPYRPP